MRVAIRRALFVGLLILARPAVAWGQDELSGGVDASAEELLSSGVALRKQGRDAEALAAFERAYALQPSPRAQAQIALAREALAQWVPAESGLIEALRSKDDPWIAKNRVYLEESLTGVQGHLGWFMAESNVDGAEVWSGGALVARLPLDGPLRVVAGELPVEARAPGYWPIKRTLQVEGRTKVHAAFLFVEPPATGNDTAAAHARESSWSHTASIASASSGVSLLLGAAATLVVARLLHDQANASCTDSVCITTDAVSQRAEAHALGNVATGLAIGGAVAVLGAIVLWELPRRGDPPARDVRSPMLSVAVNPAGASLTGYW
jgi:tetratricopeptide (TPR) repeat protein